MVSFELSDRDRATLDAVVARLIPADETVREPARPEW